MWTVYIMHTGDRHWITAFLHIVILRVSKIYWVHKRQSSKNVGVTAPVYVASQTSLRFHGQSQLGCPKTKACRQRLCHVDEMPYVATNETVLI